MNRLIIEQLSKTYPGGVKALNSISLELSDGMFGLLGPNGAGKSSLMRTIAGLQRPDEGRIIFNDHIATPGSVLIKKQLGYLPQDFGVYPRLSALRLLDHLAVLKGITNRHERKEQILALLQKTNLYTHKNKAVSSFSGGMRQRFGIAQALLGNPQLIIVDEPTAGLDPEERNRFNNLLSEIGEQVIVLLSTHLVEDVRNLCTKMAIIQNGTLIAAGRPDDFIKALDGKIWSKRIDKKDLQQEQQSHRVITSHFIAGRLHITIYSEKDPGGDFTPKQADLEDVYFTQLTLV
ncbi:ABC transporter ATP-binding protein [Niabella beijingensis]|uniref:ABC transporter ATP-binding protein n=1 Tax=Niabella beijingensis TaxID=2872700 RepID=UPI001CC0920F|nr:ABC transporter ATP-binding protein [Niabella beijingensis]MBZ4189755.1 ABC transporter ATP-binding protein [Niabella beijingensis]